jgi:hypothetical protein
MTLLSPGTSMALNPAVSHVSDADESDGPSAMREHLPKVKAVRNGSVPKSRM